MTATTASKETLGFQAEVKQLLHLMIHSLYSNKEIFLRELISNASDACDKLRFEALNNAALYGDDSELKIRVAFDKEARTITISDNGIGLSREEAIAHLGTIAKSGTKEFFSALTGDQAKDAHLIGQFGVGFYSSFIIADKVTVVSRRAGLPADQAVCWESGGEGDFSVEMVEKAGRGTDVILHLREGEDEFLNACRIGSILRYVLSREEDHPELQHHRRLLNSPSASLAERETASLFVQNFTRAWIELLIGSIGRMGYAAVICNELELSRSLSPSTQLFVFDVTCLSPPCWLETPAALAERLDHV